MKVKMDFEQFIVIFYILCTVRLTLCGDCIKIDSCSCKTSKGTVDLHKLPQKVLMIKKGDYTYEFQPCKALSEKCGDDTGKAAVCQRGTDSYDIGDLSTVQFLGEPESNLHANYTSGDRISTFNIICDKGTIGTLTSVTEHPEKTYTFEFKTQYACLGGSGGGDGKPSKKISTGSVLLILFFVFLGTYFIAGMLFLKFARGAQGTEMVPNYDFWASLPGYIKDGVAFTCRGCKTESSYSQI